jgi:Holliday junction resolvasome RuvABC endonuclease subunit
VEIFVGIDPSLNSTGLCLQFYEDNKLVKDMFYIIKPNKLTKKEQAAQDVLLNFDYVLYNKIDLDMYKDNNLFSEYWKTVNMISIVKKIKECIYDNIQGRKSYKLYIVQEGISYGSSVRTKSVFDLAGLNYMIRNEFIEKENISFFIAPPTHIKKFATGIGNCKKELIIELFKIVEPELTNKLPKVDDIADAYYMSKFARQIYIDNNKEEN